MMAAVLIIAAVVAGYGIGLMFDVVAHAEDSKIESILTTGEISKLIPYGLENEFNKLESNIMTFPFGGGPYLFLEQGYLSEASTEPIHAQIDFTIDRETKNDGYFINRVTECIFQSQNDIDTECVACILRDEFQTNIAKGELYFEPPYVANTVIPLEMTVFLNDDPYITEASNVHGVLVGICKMPDGEGCTPGYWKQSQHFDSWVIYEQNELFSDVFGVGPDITLLQALEANGGGENAFGRHAVAGLLDSTSSDVNYVFTEAEVKQMVTDAYESGDFEFYKNILEEENELVCPLN